MEAVKGGWGGGASFFVPLNPYFKSSTFFKLRSFVNDAFLYVLQWSVSRKVQASTFPPTLLSTGPSGTANPGTKPPHTMGTDQTRYIIECILQSL